jgi:hypothetical protein
VLALPFDVYEQQFNAMMLEHLGTGMRADALSPDLLRQLLAGRADFAARAEEVAVRQFTGSSAGLVERLGL